MPGNGCRRSRKVKYRYDQLWPTRAYGPSITDIRACTRLRARREAGVFAEDERVVRALSSTGQSFRLHIPIYPGCQAFPESVRATGAPVLMLLGGNDLATGTKGCLEIEAKLEWANVPVRVIVYEGAYHGWDEYIQPIKFDDVSTEDCRFFYKDGGGVRVGTPDGPLLDSQAEADDYWKSCTKPVNTYVGRNDTAYRAGKAALLEMVKTTFATAALGKAAPPPGNSLEEQLERLRREQEEEDSKAPK